jgi:hypothetical protein
VLHEPHRHGIVMAVPEEDAVASRIAKVSAFFMTSPASLATAIDVPSRFRFTEMWANGS